MNDLPMLTGERLSDEVVQRRNQLPIKMEAVTLSGQVFELRPLDPARDAESLYQVSNGEAITTPERDIPAYDADQWIWRYMGIGPFTSFAHFMTYLERLANTDNGLSLCVVEKASQRPVGVFTYMNNFPEHLKVELGNIWYSPLAQRTTANLECTYLALKHAFELGYRRVEWKCDALNERSRRSALRMGFTFEGVQESHFIIKGRNRDTAWFRMLEREWPSVKAGLEARLYG